MSRCVMVAWAILAMSGLAAEGLATDRTRIVRDGQGDDASAQRPSAGEGAASVKLQSLTSRSAASSAAQASLPDEAEKASEKKDSDDSDAKEEKASDASEDNGKADAEEKASGDDEKSGDGEEAAAASEKNASEADRAKKDEENKTSNKSDAKGDDEKKSKKERETHKVETKNLKIEVALDGTFTASQTEVVELRPEAWTSYEVVEAVAHGAQVRKGDVLVRFDDEKYDDVLADKSLEQRLSELSLMQAEEEFPRLERSVDLALEEAERDYRAVTDEYDRFLKTMRPLSMKMADYNLKMAKQELENAREELTQLEQMYEADEITEETEEIVLKRQRFQVEMNEFYHEYYTINHDYSIDVVIPRREELLTTAVQQARIALDRAKMAKSLGLSKERYELEQLKAARAKSVEQHAKLTADRSLLTIKAPCDGIAYYGRCVNGKWTDVASLESKLTPHGTVSPNTVLMTIVQPRPIYMESSASEGEIIAIKKGMKALVTPAADEEVELAGRIREAAAVPGAGNKFSVQLDVEAEDAPEWLNPGMNGKAKLIVYEAKDAVVIPLALVQRDEDKPKSAYVMVLEEVDEEEGDDEEPKRRNLKLGKKQGKDVEVLSGLKAGDRIVKDAKDVAKDDAKDDA